MTMKKLTTILAILLLCLTGFAKDLSGNFYMISTGEKLYCKKIQVGAQTIKATLENGEKVTIPTSQVKMYHLDGKTFEKLPVYVDNRNTNELKFMEFVTTRAGLKLYKYSKYVEGIDKITGAYMGVSKVDYYLVFRGDQFYVDVTERNYRTLFDFFRIKISES
jgi:hypothetical protein